MVVFIGLTSLVVCAAAVIGIIVGLIIGITRKRWKTLKSSSIVCGVALVAFVLAIIFTDSETTSTSTSTSSIPIATPIATTSSPAISLSTPAPTNTPLPPIATPANVVQATATAVVVQMTTTPNITPLTTTQQRFLTAYENFTAIRDALDTALDASTARAACQANLELVVTIRDVAQSTDQRDRLLAATEFFADMREASMDSVIACMGNNFITDEEFIEANK